MTNSARSIPTTLIRTSSVELGNAVKMCHQLTGKGSDAFVELKMDGDVHEIRCRTAYASAGIEIPVLAESNTSACVLIDSEPLLKALGACTPGVVDIEVNEAKTEVTFSDVDGFRVRLMTSRRDAISLREWPPRGVIEASGTIPAEINFAGVLRQVATHASTDPGRLNICSVYFEHDGERGHVCATNGHRMALATRKFAWPDSGLAGPSRILFSPDLCSFLPVDLPITITACRNTVFFEAEGLRIWGRRSHATFPPFRNVIPREIGQKETPMITVDREAFFKAVDAFHEIRVDKVALEIWCSDNRLRMQTQIGQADIMHGTHSIAMKGTSPCEKSISINSHYLTEAADVLQDSQIRIYWRDRLEPLVLSDRPGKDAYNVVVVMPLRKR